MREPESHVQFHKSDFTFSEQVSGQATSTRIFGIDFERLFQKNTGTADGGGAGVTLASIPVIGNVVEDKTANYALYDMMEKNKGYDVVFYPQYEKKVTRPIGIPIYTVIEVKATARLAKIGK